MSKGNTNIVGVIEVWREGQAADTYRVQVYADGKAKWISAKVQPTLQQINDYLKNHRLKKEAATVDSHFQGLKHRLHQELKSEHGLKEYAIRERISIESKRFNFQESIDGFALSKNLTSVPMKHKCIMLRFWLPFFVGMKNCQHPMEFKQWQYDAEDYVRTAEKIRGGKYSPHSYISLTNAINEYMRFLLKRGYITKDHIFSLNCTPTLEEMKRLPAWKRKKRRNAYTLEELFAIKEKIDATFARNLEMKLRAYGIYFGIGTGCRRGNLLGIKAKHLQPKGSPVPFYETANNVVDGWSRGQKGVIELEESTKTFVGTIRLPLIQPSRETLVEVCEFLKSHLKDDEPIVACHPRTVAKWWEEIAKRCGFEPIPPHDWKHTYATLGAQKLHEWYHGNGYLLQQCCLHEKYETTLQYINQASDSFLGAFTSRPVSSARSRA